MGTILLEILGFDEESEGFVAVEFTMLKYL